MEEAEEVKECLALDSVIRTQRQEAARCVFAFDVVVPTH